MSVFFNFSYLTLLGHRNYLIIVATGSLSLDRYYDYYTRSCSSFVLGGNWGVFFKLGACLSAARPLPESGINITRSTVAQNKARAND